MSHAKRRIEEEIDNDWREFSRRKAEEILRLMDEGYERIDVAQLLEKLAEDIRKDQVES